MRERYPILRDISASIRTRRTVEESELALKLEAEFRSDPTLFEGKADPKPNPNPNPNPKPEPNPNRLR